MMALLTFAQIARGLQPRLPTREPFPFDNRSLSRGKTNRPVDDILVPSPPEFTLSWKVATGDDYEGETLRTAALRWGHRLAA